MITCSNCGYENNPDDALSCSLCGKVFRKEVREGESKLRRVKPKNSIKEKLYKVYKWMKVEEKPDPFGVRCVTSVVKAFRGESDWRGRIGLIILVSSFVLGYIGLEYFHKITNHRFELSGMVDIVEGSIYILISIGILIILTTIYLVFELLFKGIIKIFKFNRKG